MAQNPNVTIKYETFPWDVFIQSIQTSLPAGNTVDVILIPGGYTCRYASGGQLLEVPADVMTLAKAQETFFAAPLRGQTCDGKLYGFPAEYNLEYGGAYVNPALFEAAGIAYPPKWANWDAVVADAKKMTTLGSDGVMTVAMGFLSSWATRETKSLLATFALWTSSYSWALEMRLRRGR